jgi:hypothetical protein
LIISVNTPVKATVFLSVLTLLCVLLAGMFLHAGYLVRHRRAGAIESIQLVSSLGLTDLCLSTEARYTRHPSMADLHSAFQDHPHALEHFPSGSIIGPPEHLKRISSHGLDR